MPSKNVKLQALLVRAVRIVVMLLMVLVVVALILWLMGVLRTKILPGSVVSHAPATARPLTAAVRRLTLPRTISAVGSIRAIHPVTIASRIVGRVIWTNLEVGAALQKGQVIVRLDDRNLKAQLAQAQAAVRLARAELHQARINQRRDKTLLATGDVTRASMDLADTGVATAQAGLARALAAGQSAKTVLAYATIHSPVNGIVRQKMISVGDTVLPGTPLARIYDPHRMQLAAVVQESLAGRLHLGESVRLHLEGLKVLLKARVRQIVPRVQSQSRTFIVKAAATFPAGIWPGMYGTLLVPVGTEHPLVIPAAAISHVGQLALVYVLAGNRVVRQVVQPGQHIAQWREILSGLRLGQRVVMPPGSAPTVPEAHP